MPANNQSTSSIERLTGALSAIGPVTIAVSGGVDSMTLACFAHRLLGRNDVRIVHAASPAVPMDAGERITRLATDEGWRLDIVDAGEFSDPEYRANPVNRCFFCKSNLYATLSAMSDSLVLSGTNTDDLGDYRPGLEAARIHNVRHPYVEAGINKQQVRSLAHELGLPEFAALPASPCLSSRVETGIAIEQHDLAMIDRVESWCRKRLAPETVRCRRRHTGIFIELDEQTHASLTASDQMDLIKQLRLDIDGLSRMNVAFTEYVRGSAFVGDRTAAMSIGSTAGGQTGIQPRNQIGKQVSNQNE
jgi:pyridinium-3,5-biscarboxylic acid mononucleotide sulfurtransferase